MANNVAAYHENVRYKGSLADPTLVAELVKVGRDVKARNLDPGKRGKEYMIEWPGRFTLMAYPTQGKFQFIPNKRCPEVDATLAFLTFLCGTEPVPNRFQREWGLITPPLTRLNYSRVAGAQVLQRLTLAFVEIEQAILSDPLNSLPKNEWVSQTHPATKYLPEETVVFSINGSCDKKTGNKKEACYAGSPGATTVMHAINHRSAEFQDWARQEIDLVRDVVEQVDRARLEQRDSAAQVVMQVEDNTKVVKQAMRMVKTTNKDHGQLSERLRQHNLLHETQTDLQQQQLEAQWETAERVTASELGIREEIQFNTQETAEGLRTLGGVINLLGNKVDQLDLQQHIRFQGLLDQERANFQEMQATRQDIQQAKNEVLSSVGDLFQRLAAYLAERDVRVDQRLDSLEALYLDHKATLERLHLDHRAIKKRLRRHMVDIYASIWTVLDAAPDMIAARVGDLIRQPAKKAWYYLKRMREMGIVGREQRDAEVTQTSNHEQTQVGDDPTSPPPKFHFMKRIIRRLWHYFLRQDSRATGTGDTHQTQPIQNNKHEGEKT